MTVRKLATFLCGAVLRDSSFIQARKDETDILGHPAGPRLKLEPAPPDIHPKATIDEGCGPWFFIGARKRGTSIFSLPPITSTRLQRDFGESSVWGRLSSLPFLGCRTTWQAGKPAPRKPPLQRNLIEVLIIPYRQKNVYRPHCGCRISRMTMSFQ
jgi:hypothetical protein